MLRYAITDGSVRSHQSIWLARVKRWLADGLDFIQIREKDLSARQLASLVRSVSMLPNPLGSRILVNDRTDVAVACGAHGVHLRAGSLDPNSLRSILPAGFVISVSCHDDAAVRAAGGADYILAAPVFQPLSKDDRRPTLGMHGLARLARVATRPVFALGGVTLENTQSCLEAGAAGVAGITYFSGIPDPFPPRQPDAEGVPESL